MSPRMYPFRGSISILVGAMGSFLTACSALAVLWDSLWVLHVCFGSDFASMEAFGRVPSDCMDGA
jgi:hypothetical protein